MKQILTSVPIFNIFVKSGCSLVTVPESAILVSFKMMGHLIYVNMLVDESVLESNNLLKTWHFHLMVEGMTLDTETDQYLAVITVPPEIKLEYYRQNQIMIEFLHIISTTQTHETDSRTALTTEIPFEEETTSETKPEITSEDKPENESEDKSENDDSLSNEIENYLLSLNWKEDDKTE